MHGAEYTRPVAREQQGVACSVRFGLAAPRAPGYGSTAVHRTFLWLALSLLGCKSAEPTPASATGAAAAAVSATAPRALPARRLSFEIVATRPATLLYALERASARGREDQRYQRWLFGEDLAMRRPWLEAYAELRARTRTQVDRGDGPYDTWLACGYDGEALDDALKCLSGLVQPGEVEVVRAALAEVDALLREPWRELEPILRSGVSELATVTESPAGRELSEALAGAAALPADTRLVFKVVLVGKPQGPTYRASQAGRYLVLEIDRQRAPAEQVHVVFHEIAHLAAVHAPGRAALERGLERRGRAGIVASNLWNEAFATAFGNGLAASRLRRDFDPARPLYDDAAVDALGRALWLSWSGGQPGAIDAALGEQVLGLVQTAWPPERWRPRDVFARVVVLADEAAATQPFERAIRAARLARFTPLPADLKAALGGDAPGPRVVLTTLQTLRGRRDVLEPFGLELNAVEWQLARQGPSVYWRDDDRGVPLVLVVAPQAAALREAAQVLGAAATAPPPGWSPLRDGGAKPARAPR